VVRVLLVCILKSINMTGKNQAQIVQVCGCVWLCVAVCGCVCARCVLRLHQTNPCLLSARLHV
jgi:uncharacterized membrane protein YozB (DUF420 family)